MCGIIGLFNKTDTHNGKLGALMTPMLTAMTGRGPDSAGFVVYGEAPPDTVKITATGLDVRTLGKLTTTYDVDVRGDHILIKVTQSDRDNAIADIISAGGVIVGEGHHMELYKSVGLPADVSERFGLAGMSGTHGLGHTRMATESAVTTDGAHPFSTGDDLCLVHNGSLSNHASMRRRLVRKGIDVRTQNDSEVAAAYLTWRMSEGMALAEALEAALVDLDGFFTFVVGTASGFGVLRDPIACKPAVMAETEDLIAFASEYRALADLPGIENARIWEPEPSKVYFWERDQ